MVVAKPLAWLVYGCWLGMVFLATVVIGIRNRIRHAAAAKQ